MVAVDNDTNQATPYTPPTDAELRYWMNWAKANDHRSPDAKEFLNWAVKHGKWIFSDDANEALRRVRKGETS